MPGVRPGTLGPWLGSDPGRGSRRRGCPVDSPAVDPAWQDELAEFLRIPSVSADPAHAADVVAAAEWVAAFVRRAGGQAELVPWGERPLVLGEIPASNGASGAPTVLL